MKSGELVQPPELELEKAMLDLAMGRFYVEEIKSVIDPNTGKISRLEKVKKQLPPNPVIQMFLAKKRMPKKYGDSFDDDDWIGGL